MSDNRIAVIQIGGSEEDQKVRAHGSPQGVVRNVTAALSIVTNFQDNGGKRCFEGLTEGSGARIAKALEQFTSADNALERSYAGSAHSSERCCEGWLHPEIAGRSHCEVGESAEDLTLERKDPQEPAHVLQGRWFHWMRIGKR